jgi:hypothetical protein
MVAGTTLQQQQNWRLVDNATMGARFIYNKSRESRQLKASFYDKP